MKNIRYFLIICSAILLCSTVSCKKDKTTRAEATEEVDVAYPQVDSVVLHNQYPAYSSAVSEADVVARVNGYVRKKFFDDGQWVAAGAPLFAIESTTYADQVSKAEAQLQTAIASEQYAEKEYEAMKKALESDAVSKMEVVQSESNLKQARASIATAKAALQTAKMMLGYCTIRAPFAGRVAEPNVIVGDYVSGEASPVTITRIYDDSTIKINFSINDDQYLALTSTIAGKKVDLNNVPVSFGDSILHQYIGKLDYQAPDVNKSTGTVSLRVDVPNPKGELKSGMYATVYLPYDVNPKAVVIRDASIATDQLGKYVYVVNDSNKVIYTPIKVGELYQDSLRIVNSGLTPNNRYVTRALLKVRDQMIVKPIETNNPQYDKVGTTKKVTEVSTTKDSK